MNRKIKHELERYFHDTFGVTPPETLIDPMVQHLDKAIMQHYFSEGGEWKPNYSKFTHTGWALADRVNRMNPERVLDVGCGYNLFKDKIANLWGIDPHNTRADEMVGILDFQSDVQWDVVLCLGSINFGSAQKVMKELEKVVGLTKPGGSLFFRVNPGLQHDRAEAQWIDFFDWTPDWIHDTADFLGCRVTEIEPDQKRYYFRWIKR